MVNRAGRPRGPFSPLDVRCRACAVSPGERCLTADRARRRSPHPQRTADARSLTGADPARAVPGHVTDAWTCPCCGDTYWPPAQWEPEVWRGALEAARSMHGRRHDQQRIDARDAGRATP